MEEAVITAQYGDCRSTIWIYIRFSLCCFGAVFTEFVREERETNFGTKLAIMILLGHKSDNPNQLVVYNPVTNRMLARNQVKEMRPIEMKGEETKLGTI